MLKKNKSYPAPRAILMIWMVIAKDGLKYVYTIGIIPPFSHELCTDDLCYKLHTSIIQNGDSLTTLIIVRTTTALQHGITSNIAICQVDECNIVYLFLIIGF